MKISKTKYSELLKEIRQLVEQARHNVIRNINTELLLTYWNVGRLIVAKEHSEQYDETSSALVSVRIKKMKARWSQLFGMLIQTNQFTGMSITPIEGIRHTIMSASFIYICEL